MASSPHPANGASSSSSARAPHPGLKILISTWNMGDSIPKGDLEVLYGAIPAYVPPPPTVDRAVLPDFGTAQGHPYHLIAIAAQECPTQSGVPRGIAAGVTKGMYGGERAREKLKEKEKLREVKERVKELGREAGLKGKEGRGKERTGSRESGAMEDVLKTAEEEWASGSPVQGGPHHGHHAMHVTVPAKGWSDILEGGLGRTGCQRSSRLTSFRAQTTFATASRPTSAPRRHPRPHRPTWTQLTLAHPSRSPRPQRSPRQRFSRGTQLQRPPTPS